ncbi:MAG: hypothetical protein KC933_17435, partial [Myxococcales bacterium]|nr:hypothetical protein [Myxococcales bacterium]
IRAGAHGEAEAVARGLLPRVPPSAANRVAQIRGALADALAGQGRDAEAERWRTATSTTP